MTSTSDGHGSPLRHPPRRKVERRPEPDAATTVLVLVEDEPYRSERAFAQLRLAIDLVLWHDVRPTVYLEGETARFALAARPAYTSTAFTDAAYTIERLLQGAIRTGGAVRICGTCLDAQGIAPAALLPGAKRAYDDELADLTTTTEMLVTL